MVFCAIILTVLLGMAGLAIDGGLMLMWRRTAQNAADAAVLAAIVERFHGSPYEVAAAAADEYVHVKYSLPDADVTLNEPPSSGPYASNTGANAVFLECLVQFEVDTFLIHILDGTASKYTVGARAVAGMEPRGSGIGAMALEILNRTRPKLIKDIEDSAKRTAQSALDAFEDGYRGRGKSVKVVAATD